MDRALLVRDMHDLSVYSISFLILLATSLFFSELRKSSKYLTKDAIPVD
jgi:hypothetical protein